MKRRISSQESEDGLLPFASPAGPMAPPFGLGAAPVSPSALPGSAKEPTTNATYGRSSFDLSEPIDLPSSLANRLRARLDMRGSTLYLLTWNAKATPQGRRILQRRASAPHTSASDCIGWPTPLANDSGGSNYSYSSGDKTKISLKLGGGGAFGGVADSAGSGLAQRGRQRGDTGKKQPAVERNCHDGWRDPVWLDCRDGKKRPIKPGIEPVAPRLPGRVGRLRAYGNAIVPALAAEFVGAFIDCVVEGAPVAIAPGIVYNNFRRF